MIGNQKIIGALGPHSEILETIWTAASDKTTTTLDIAGNINLLAAIMTVNGMCIEESPPPTEFCREHVKLHSSVAVFCC